MGRIAKTCLRSLLKLANSVMGIIGIAMILYSCWMIRVWQRDSSYVDYSSTGPWFIYSFLGMGVALGAIACLGHIAADSANGCCLSFYVVIISLLLLLEIAMTADMLLNSDWEKDLPEDPTGRLHDFEDFVKSNFDIFQWIGLLFTLTQGLSVLLAVALRTLGTNQGSYYNYDTDEDYAPERLPLVNNKVQPPPYVKVISDPHFATNNSSTWNANK
ncbi:tetraspanin-19-like isoform X2 [Juglans microcarpa x Juglans regia]|uniref:tetraspanin-19-like isoform X2 n=1 Tax=Juglans microcarpa x Juglans regia TaxID=2249226 RepID=UPI001B7EDD9F|nr:tetraspanin-19-like isoform X2 [Juglans microcarpa x Juglans regia]